MSPLVLRPGQRPDTRPDHPAGTTYRFFGSRGGHDSEAGPIGDHTWAQVYPHGAGELAGLWGACITGRQELPLSRGFFEAGLPSRAAAEAWVEERLGRDGVVCSDDPARPRPGALALPMGAT